MKTLISDKHQIELLYPTYYYYYQFDKRFRLSLPLLNLGIGYRNWNSKSTGFCVQMSTDYMRDFQSVSLSGQIAERLVLYPSIGVYKSFSPVSRNFYYSFQGELIGRIGQLTVYRGSNEFESVFDTYDLLDFGISIGSNLAYSPNHKVDFTIGLKHSFLGYIHDKGAPIYGIPSSPRNLTTFTLGIGLNFSKTVE